MRILISVATAAELGPVIAKLGVGSARHPRLTAYAHAGREVHVLITGVGMVATAAWGSRALAEVRYDLALNLGVCGTFDRSLEPGTVVHVVTDRVAELGAEDDDRFLPIEELDLADAGEVPFLGAELVNPAPPDNPVIKRLPQVAGITVNTVHGNERSIAAVIERFSPQVESMEGAAFMYACLMHTVPFAQVRAVSNVVEKRNRSAWRVREAIAALGSAALAAIEAS